MKKFEKPIPKQKPKSMINKKKKPLSLSTLFRMVIEWEDAASDDNLQRWWDKYPSYSFREVIEAARKKLKMKPRKLK
jgi:hypothetical protein